LYDLNTADLEPLRELLIKMIGDIGLFILKREPKERNTEEVDEMLAG
jgi:hypothetical protein